MTLLPSSDFGIRGWEGNAYDVNEICAHPYCNKRSAHAHHMWARSFLRGQPYDWVRLPDGTILGNRIGLCVEHHEMVTGEIGGYRSKLWWSSGLMYWMDKDTGMESMGAEVWTLVGPLDPQPPVAVVVTTDLGSKVPPKYVVPSDNAVAHGHVNPEDEKVCPVCGHHKQAKQPKAKLERRKAKEWVAVVPDDAEVGADVLDDFIEEFAIPMGASAWTSRLKRYHVLVAVLTWASINRTEFIADMAEAAERRLAK